KASVAAASASNKIFASSEQQDAQEFLQALLEAVHQDLETEGASVVSELLEGQLQSELQCTCGSHQSLEAFWSLPLPLPPAGQVDLLTAVESFCAEEPVEGPWRCETCGATAATRRFRLHCPPKVLQLHLKRFQWSTPQAAKNQTGASEVSAPVPKPSEAGPAERLEPPVKVAKPAESDTTGAVAKVPEVAEAPKVAELEVAKVAEAHDSTLTPLQRAGQLPWEKQETPPGMTFAALAT
ncbi:unnamed protein product, partial [Effrenium voratum]